MNVGKEGAREGGSARLSERERERERERKKVHTVPQFFVEHLALTLPCFFSSLPPHTHTLTHRPTDLAGYSSRQHFISTTVLF